MIEIYLLGTSSGLPSINRSFPSILIKDLKSGESVLFDVGENTQRQLLKYKVGLGKIKNIFISHNHIDHFLGLYGLIETYKVLDLELPTIHLPERIPVLASEFDFKYIRTGKTIEGLNYTVTPYRVKHIKNSYGFLYATKPTLKYMEDKIKGLDSRDFINLRTKGYTMKWDKIIRIEDISYVQEGIKVFYTGDTMYYEELATQLGNVDILIHDCTFIDEADQAKSKKHSTLYDAVNMAKKLNAKLLILTHLSNKYDNYSIEGILDKNTILARDGLKIGVKREKEDYRFDIIDMNKI